MQVEKFTDFTGTNLVSKVCYGLQLDLDDSVEHIILLEERLMQAREQQESQVELRAAVEQAHHSSSSSSIECLNDYSYYIVHYSTKSRQTIL